MKRYEGSGQDFERSDEAGSAYIRAQLHSKLSILVQNSCYKNKKSEPWSGNILGRQCLRACGTEVEGCIWCLEREIQHCTVFMPLLNIGEKQSQFLRHTPRWWGSLYPVGGRKHHREGFHVNQATEAKA